MKYVAITLLVCSSLFVGQNRQQKLFWVKGKVTRTADYCGGAYMPEAIEQARIPVPFPDKTIYFKRGNKNELKEELVDSATTDTTGRFEIKLPPGEYCIVENYKTHKLVIPQNNKYTTYDAECLKNNWSTCDYSFNLKDHDIDTITINYHQHCSFTQPCQQYYGPLPPAMAH